MDLLSKIEGINVGENTLLGSIDVEALYSSIPHEAGLKAVEYYLNMRGRHLSLQNEFILQLLAFVLEHNFFLFNGQYFHQLRGTAMGSACAPTYANLLLGWWEATEVFTDERENETSPILLWTRYIDDVFVLWQGSETSFRTFVTDLNSNSIGLKFTYEVNEHVLPFLDVLISKDTRGTLHTKVYRKKTATNSLLQWGSCHPRPLIKGIPKGQFLRTKRNCSDQITFNSQARDLKNRFYRRGYPKDIVEGAYLQASKMDRNTLLTPKRRDPQKQALRIIGQYDICSTQVRRTLGKYWDILKLDPSLEGIVPSSPLITFRKGRSLRDRLVNSHFTDKGSTGTWLQRPKGCFKCTDCSFCSYVTPSKSFKSSVTNIVYDIKDFINCKSENLVYMCTCPCPKDYVGKTTRQLRRRIGEHLGNIRRGDDTPLATHMRLTHPGHEKDLKFVGLEIVRKSQRGGNMDKNVLKKETEWIFRLDSMAPNGINEALNFGCFL